jgi:hypothetical protein
MTTKKSPRVPRERQCDISGEGHSIPSGPRAMAPTSAPSFLGKVRWLSNEKFRVTFNQDVRIWRHHDPDRLRAILRDEAIDRIEVKPSFELLVIYLRGVKLPYRFYMTGGQLENCSLGRNVWTMRSRPLPKDWFEDEYS